MSCPVCWLDGHLPVLILTHWSSCLRRVHRCITATGDVVCASRPPTRLDFQDCTSTTCAPTRPRHWWTKESTSRWLKHDWGTPMCEPRLRSTPVPPPRLIDTPLIGSVSAFDPVPEATSARSPGSAKARDCRG